MYDLSSVVECEALASVRPGTSIVVSGPAMTGKTALALDLLADGARAGEGALVVTTGNGARETADAFGERDLDVRELMLGVVDCRGGEEREADHEGYHVQHVSSPGDLTGIGMEVTKVLEAFVGAGARRGRLALLSLSTMLNYTDERAVFQFSHVLTARLDAAGYLGVFTIDADAHDDRTVQVIKQAFDGMIEVRDAEGSPEARAVGLAAEPSAWSPI